MAATKSTGVTGGERRRKPRGAAAPGLADGEWLGRLDALADQLAGLDDRGTIIDHVVSETMKLLPADQVVVRADDDAITAPLFTEENDGVPARAVIPLAIAGRRFGAVEIAMKPSRAVGPSERTLSIALARQCALALDSLALRKAQREGLLAEPVHVPVEETMIESSAPLEATATAAPVDAAPAPATDVTAVQATIARLEADLRALAKLARSAELPPTTWVDQAERKALRDLEELRAQLPGAEDAA